MGTMGGGSAGGAGADPDGKGQGVVPSAVCRHDGRYPGDGQPGVKASHPDELQGRGRGYPSRRCDCFPDQDDCPALRVIEMIPDHHILMAIKDLSLAARQTIDGFMNGINKSRVKGPGLEFSQYRSYQPGDDLRWLDWKRYARSDRYYIRESEVETSISVRLLIDASLSMNHREGPVGVGGFTKLDYAKHLAAALAWLANRQGDALGLYVF